MTSRRKANAGSSRNEVIARLGAQIGGGGSIKSVEALVLTTGSGGDIIETSTAAADDRILTAAGKDRITVVLAGNDSVDGGAGRDRLVVDCGGTEADFSATSGPDGYSGGFDGPGANNVGL